MSEEEAINEIENYLDYEGSVSMQAIAILYTAYNKEKEKNKELQNRLNQMYNMQQIYDLDAINHTHISFN